MRPGAATAPRPPPWQQAAALLARAAGALADEWVPMRCVLCMRRGAVASAAGNMLCDDCVRTLAGRQAARCLGCALPLPVCAGVPARRPRFCDACCAARSEPAWPADDYAAPPPVGAPEDAPPAGALDAAVAAIDYAPPADRLILAMKRARSELAALLAVLVTEALRNTFDRCCDGTPAGRAIDACLEGLRPQAVVAMPLSTAKLSERGFNQSLALARPVAKRLGLPLLAAQALRRTRETAPQKSLQAAARADNLIDAFDARSTEVAGLRLLLVDNVMATGATLREAAWTPKDAGAASVVGLVAARVR